MDLKKNKSINGARLFFPGIAATESIQELKRDARNRSHHHPDGQISSAHVNLAQQRSPTPSIHPSPTVPAAQHRPRLPAGNQLNL